MSISKSYDYKGNQIPTRMVVSPFLTSDQPGIGPFIYSILNQRPYQQGKKRYLWPCQDRHAGCGLAWDEPNQLGGHRKLEFIRRCCRLFQPKQQILYPPVKRSIDQVLASGRSVGDVRVRCGSLKGTGIGHGTTSADVAKPDRRIGSTLYLQLFYLRPVTAAYLV
jgi:hypothetical protein